MPEFILFVILNNATFLLFLLAALLAEILGTLGGFGSSVFFVPLANFFLDYQSVLGITALFHVVSNVSKIYLFRKYFDWKIALWIGVPSVILVVGGALLSSYWKSDLLQFYLGIFLCIFSVFFLWKPNFTVAVHKLNMIGFGSLAGFLAGLLGTGGAVRGLMLSSLGLNKEVFVGTSAIIDFGVDATRAGIYAANGFVHWHDMWYIIGLFIVAFVGSYLGKLILQKMPQEWFRKIVLVFVFFSGLAMIFKFIQST